MNLLQRLDKPLKHIAVLSYVYIVYLYYNLWTQPQLIEVEQIYTYCILMAFEFILVHSGFMMFPFAGKKYALLAFTVAYSLFAWAMNSFLLNNTILIVYLLVTLNRLSVAFEQKEGMMSRLAFQAASKAMLYLFAIVIVAMNQKNIPVFGLTDEFLLASNYAAVKTTGGIFTDTPHIGLCFGVVYFSGMALIDLGSIYLFNKPLKSSLFKLKRPKSRQSS